MKTAVITGASRGIGAAIANMLLADGWRVIGICRSQPRIGVEHIVCDLRQLASITRLQIPFVEVDLVICAAGIGQFAGAESFSVQQIEEIMRVNFTAHAVLLGTIIPVMKREGAGRIIAIGSEAGLQGARQGSIYCASKFALRGYMQSLRLECRSAGVGVSLINPGLVRTDFHQNVHFQPAVGEWHALQVADVCQCVKLILELPVSAVVEEINLQPMQPQVEKKRTFYA